MRTIYAFFSVKGGVGKTAVAVTCAAGFAARGRPVAVVDADFTGTSIADGLALRAPELVDRHGHFRWTGPTRGYLDRTETLRRRAARDHAPDRPTLLPFVDDLVVGPEQPFEAAAVAWIHDDLPTVRWYPSSPAMADTERAVRAVFGGTLPFPDRLGAVVGHIADGLADDGVVLVDAPPGTFGIPTAIARAFGSSSGVRDDLRPVLVTTPDRNDLHRSLHEFMSLKVTFPQAVWLLNRNQQNVETVRAAVRAFAGPALAASRVEDALRDLGWDTDLASMFLGGGLRVPPELGARALKLLAAG